MDAINETIGACKAAKRTESQRAVNPLWWLWTLVVLILRFPFLLLQSAGFDAGRIEEHLVGKVFKLLEIAAIAYILMRWGFSKAEVVDLLKAVLAR